MKDYGEALRKAYFTVLGNGALVYEGNQVPVVDEKLDVDISQNDIYVLMLDQLETDDQTADKSRFTSECVLRMNVINQRKSTNSKIVVESVCDQIFTILFPDKVNTPLKAAIDAPFRITYAKKLNANYNPLIQNENGFMISKILEFKNRITQ